MANGKAATAARYPGYELLGVKVHPLTMDDLHEIIAGAIAAREKTIIVSQNLHSVYVYNRDARMRELHARADYMRIDGMPLVWLGRLLGYPLRIEHRVTWVDWLKPLMTVAATNGWRVFYLGSAPGVAERGAKRLQSELPELQIAVAHGYFDARPGSEENKRVIELIEAFDTDILIVGMGMPRQEHWILDNLDRIRASAILTSGACMDYYAGVVSTPPRWMGKVGLEWFYRFMGNPRRFARRYFVEPWVVPPLFVRDLVTLWRQRRRPTSQGHC